MNALANHSFIKMNGLGNEIVVVDMRASPQAITAADARAAAAAAPYDQLMAVYPPRAVGTDAYVRIYNNDGSEAGACGNGMRCVADILFKQSGNSTLTVETRAGLLACFRGDAPLTSTVDMGQPRFHWTEIPLAEEFFDTRAIELQVGPIELRQLGGVGEVEHPLDRIDVVVRDAQTLLQALAHRGRHRR